MAIVRTREIVRIEYGRITSVCEDQNLFFKKNQSPYQFMCVYSAVAYFATAFSFGAQLFRNSPPFIRILNTLCSFSPFARLKMLMKGGGSPIRTLICIIKNASYVQARRFILFIHTDSEQLPRYCSYSKIQLEILIIISNYSDPPQNKTSKISCVAARKNNLLCGFANV